MNWFDVDKEGLGKLLERRGKEFAIAELISNAWDQNTTQVTVTLTKNPGKATAFLQVEDDDPDGFQNLSHAYTLFAESNKKDKAEKRGRFNMGEKLVLAVCDEARILSTKGGVLFDEKGRHMLRQKRVKGSIFEGTIRMTTKEYDDAVAFVRTLIPPPGIRTLFNGEQIQPRHTKATFELPLETHIADAEGMLKKSVRKTVVRVYEPLADEVPSLYEMGIPVVETNDLWHIDVGQKLPLSFERDNVPPAYLRKLRAEVMNHLYTEVKGDDAASSWVKAATEAPEAKPEAVNHMLTEVFGPKRVVFDPSDQEANKLAVSQGYTVIYPRSLSPGQWEHVRENKLALPAGQVTPSPKAEFEAAHGAEESKFMAEDKWTPGIKNIVGFTTYMGMALGLGRIKVRVLNDLNASFYACYGGSTLIYNVGRLGYKWFDEGVNVKVMELMIHEFAHHFSGDHLSEDYHDAMSELGAKLTQVALENPAVFANHGASVWQGYNTLANM